MAESKMYGAQKAVNTCTDHEHEEVEMYCRTCWKAICTKCVKGDHKEHDWETIMKIAKELRKQTGQRKLKAESVSRSILIGIEKMLDFLASEAETELESNCSKLETKRKSILDYVNKRFDEMKSKCKIKNKSKMDGIHDQRKLLESKGKRIKLLVNNMEIGANEYTDSDLIELHDEINRLLNELQGLAVPPFDVRDRMDYMAGSSVVEILDSLIGSVEETLPSAEILLEKELIMGDTSINSICLNSENEAWIHPTETTKNHLIDSCGNIKQSIDLECRVLNFDVSKDEVTFFLNKKTCTLKTISKDGKITTLFSTSPLIPLHVSLTQSGELLLTIVDEDSLYRSSSSRRLVRRASLSGEIIMEYEFDNDRTTPLFCRPMRPIEHYNGNICVINQYYNQEGNQIDSIYGLNCNGHVIFKYNGIDDKFNPLDICYDIEGNTLISDSANRRIHVLDLNGVFMRYILTPESFTGGIYAIALLGKNLWISNYETGTVKIFTFK